MMRKHIHKHEEYFRTLSGFSPSILSWVVREKLADFVQSNLLTDGFEDKNAEFTECKTNYFPQNKIPKLSCSCLEKWNSTLKLSSMINLYTQILNSTLSYSWPRK